MSERYKNNYVNPEKDDYWWKIDVDDRLISSLTVGKQYRVVNELGGWHYHTFQVTDDIKEVEDWEQVYELNHDPIKCLNEAAAKSNSSYGWLDPDGRFYGCDFMEHDQLAYDLWDKTDEELVYDYGFVRITKDWLEGAMYMCGRKLTDAQIDWLNKRGIPIQDWDRPI